MSLAHHKQKCSTLSDLSRALASRVRRTRLALRTAARRGHAPTLRLHDRREFDGKGLLPFRVIARDAANANTTFKCAQGVNKERTFPPQLNAVQLLFKQMNVQVLIEILSNRKWTLKNSDCNNLKELSLKRCLLQFHYRNVQCQDYFPLARNRYLVTDFYTCDFNWCMLHTKKVKFCRDHFEVIKNEACNKNVHLQNLCKKEQFSTSCRINTGAICDGEPLH